MLSGWSGHVVVVVTTAPSTQERPATTAVLDRHRPQAPVAPSRRVPRGLPSWVGLALIGCVAAVVSLVASREGLAFASDSAVYLGTAENLLGGRGPTSPITLVFTDAFSPLRTLQLDGSVPVTTLPPGYSMVLAAIGALGLDSDTAARLVGAVALGGAAGLLALMARRLANGSWCAAAGAVVLFLVVGPVFDGFYPSSWVLLSMYALSETLFLALALLALLAVARLVRRGAATDVWWAGLAIGATVLVRYLGLAVLAAAVLVILFRTAWPRRTRVRCTLALGALALAPTLLWLLGLWAAVGRGRPSTPLRIRPLELDLFTDGVDNVAHWFVPRTVTGAGAIAVVLAVVALVAAAVLLVRARPADSPPPPWEGPDPLFVLLALFAGCSVALVLVSRWVANSNLEFDARLLAPVRAVVVVLLVSLGYHVLRRLLRGRPVRSAARRASGATLLGCALLTIPFAAGTSELVTEGTPVGRPRAGGVLRAVDRLPPGARLVTNAPETVWLVTGRRSVLVPVKRVPEVGARNPTYRRDLAQMPAVLGEPSTFLVLLDGVDGRTLADAPTIDREVSLSLVSRFADGSIYRASPPPG
jgi:hypothetical protein